MAYYRRRGTYSTLTTIFGKSPKSMLYSALLILVIGLVYGAQGLSQQIDARAMMKYCTAVTTGTVTDVKSQRQTYRRHGRASRDPSRHLYSATVAYTVDGKDYTVTTGYSYHVYHKGNEVQVHYDPGDPELRYAGDISGNGKTKMRRGGLLVVLALIDTAFAYNKLKKQKLQSGVKTQKSYEEIMSELGDDKHVKEMSQYKRYYGTDDENYKI